MSNIEASLHLNSKYKKAKQNIIKNVQKYTDEPCLLVIGSKIWKINVIFWWKIDVENAFLC